MVTDRQSQREWAKRRRKKSPGSVDQVCSHLENWLASPQREEGYVVLYDSMDQEIDLSPLVESGRGPFATTRTPEGGWDLTIHPWESARELHRFGYRQPKAGSLLVADSEISVVLVPGLVFDHYGNRLGWGAGYYDRFLARLDRSVTKIGISDGAIVPLIDAEPHDVAMDYLATNEGVMAVRVN